MAELKKGKDFEITEVRSFLEISRGGSFVKKYRIYFKDLLTGFEDFIDVEESVMLRPEEVEKLVAERIIAQRKLMGKG